MQFGALGAVVNNAGTPGMGAYQTAEWAVEAFSEVLANEVKPLGIEVTIIEPGGFRPGQVAGASHVTVRLHHLTASIRRHRESIRSPSRPVCQGALGPI